MKNVFKNLLKFTLYLAYFIGALIGFIYLTLPLDEAKALVVRDLSARYNADVMVDDIEVSGLTDLEVKIKGIYIKRRPSAEQQSKIEASELAHTEWEARKADFEAEQEALAAQPAQANSGQSPKTTKKKSKRKRRKKTFKEPEPEIISGPIPVALDEITLKTNAFDVASDALDGIVLNEPLDIVANAEAMGGQATINLNITEQDKQVAIEATGIEIAQLLTLLDKNDYPTNGTFDANGAIAFLNDEGMKGELAITLTDSEIGPGLFHTDKEKRVDQAITLPMVRLSELQGSIKFAKKRMTLKDINFNGPDVEGKISGYVTMNEDKTKRRLNIPLRFKFADKFKRKHTPIRLLLGLKEIKRGTDRKTGVTNIRLVGPLGKWKIKGERQRKKSRSKSSQKKKDRKKGSRAQRNKESRETSKSRNRNDRSRKSASAKVTSARDLTPKTSKPPSRSTRTRIPDYSKRSLTDGQTDKMPPGYPSSSSRTDPSADDDEDEEEDVEDSVDENPNEDEDDDDAKSSNANDEDDDDEESEDDN